MGIVSHTVILVPSLRPVCEFSKMDLLEMGWCWLVISCVCACLGCLKEWVLQSIMEVLEQNADTALQRNHDNVPQLVKASGCNLLVIKRPTILSSMKDPLSKGEGLRVKIQTVKNVNIVKLSHATLSATTWGILKLNILRSTFWGPCEVWSSWNWWVVDADLGFKHITKGN